jgi:hypothetical protein
MALVMSLNLVQFWYGFSRYTSCGENMSSGIFFGQAIDHKFEQIRDVCSFHANGDYRRRNQTVSTVLTLPFTIWYHATTGFIFIGIWIAKKLANKQIQYAPAFWGILLTNLVCAGFWLFGGAVCTGLAMLHLFIQQRLYSSLLCRRGFPDFMLSMIVGNLVAVKNKAAMSDLLDDIDITCIPWHSDSICASARASGGTARSSYDPPSVASVYREGLVEDLESGSVSVNWNSDNIDDDNETKKSTLLPDLSTEMLTDISDDFDERLELLDEVSVWTEPQPVSPKKTQDVYFGVETHEGTQMWKHTAIKARLMFNSDAYTEREHDWIMEQLEGRKFYHLKESSHWVMAGEDAIRQRCRNDFADHVKSEASEPYLGEDSSCESEFNARQSKSRFTWRLTPKTKNGTKKTGFWKSMIRSTDKVFREIPSRELGIVLNRDENACCEPFREVLKEAAEKYYPVEYSDKIHRWVLEYIGEQTLHVESSTTGFYRPASASEIYEKASEAYGFFKERLQLVDYLLKEVDIEMSEYHDDGEIPQNPEGCQQDGERTVSMNSKDFSKSTDNTMDTGNTEADTKTTNVNSIVDERSTVEGSTEIVPKRMKSKFEKDERIHAQIATILINEFLQENNYSESADESDASTIRSLVGNLEAEATVAYRTSDEDGGMLDRGDSVVRTPATRQDTDSAENEVDSVENTRKSKRSRSKFVLGLWKRALKRRNTGKTNHDEQKQQVETQPLPDKATRRTNLAVSRDDNLLLDGTSSVVPETMGDDIELIPKRQKPQVEKEENIYDQILSVLTEEFMKDGIFSDESSDSGDASSTGSSSGNITNESDSAGPRKDDDEETNEDISMSECDSSGVRPAAKSPPPIYLEDSKARQLDATSLYDYIVYKIRQEQAACGCQNDTTESHKVDNNHAVAQGGLHTSNEATDSEVTKFPQDTTEDAEKATNDISEAGETAAKTLGEADGRNSDENKEEMEENRLDTGDANEEESAISASIEVEALEEPISPIPHSPKVMRTIVHVSCTIKEEVSDQESNQATPDSDNNTSDETTKEDSECIPAGEGEPRRAPVIDPSVEVEVHEIPTWLLPNSPKSLHMVVRVPYDESDKESDSKRRPRKMIVPKTFSPSSAAEQAVLFSADEEVDPASSYQDKKMMMPKTLSPSSLMEDATSATANDMPTSVPPTCESTHIQEEDIAPKRKMMAPKTLVMKDVISNKHDYVSSGILPPEDRPSSEPNVAEDTAAPNSPTNHKAPEEVLTLPTRKKRIMPKTFSLGVSEYRDEETLDDSKKIKKWMTESRSKRPRSKFFTSLLKRDSTRKDQGNEEAEDARQEADLADFGPPDDDEPLETPRITNGTTGQGGEARETNAETRGSITAVTRRRTIPIANDEDDEAMYCHLLTVLEECFILESSDISSQSAKKIGSISFNNQLPPINEGTTEFQGDPETIPAVSLEEALDESAQARNVDANTLYRYIVYKVQQENAACGCYDDTTDGADEARNPDDSASNRCDMFVF